MSVEELLKQYLPSVNIMQLATSVNDQPWTCTVHYYSDNNFNLFWLSTVDRRHSQEIKQNPRVSAAIVIHENTPTEKYIIGISVEGTAELVDEKNGEKALNGYAKKHHSSPGFIEDVRSGKNPHKLYRLKPSNIVMFNNKDFPDDPRQEWQASS